MRKRTQNKTHVVFGAILNYMCQIGADAGSSSVSDLTTKSVLFSAGELPNTHWNAATRRRPLKVKDLSESIYVYRDIGIDWRENRWSIKFSNFI